MRRLLGLAVVAALFISGAALVGTTPAAQAGAGDGTLTVQVIRDVNGNASYEAALEVGIAGATVTVTDAAGATATGTTAADGTVTVNLGTVTGGKYRVDVAAPAGATYLQPAPAGKGLSTTSEFVDVSGGQNKSLIVGLWNPADYCQNNPKLCTSALYNLAHRSGNPPTPIPNISNHRSLMTFDYNTRGSFAGYNMPDDRTATPAVLSRQVNTGSVYGLAYNKKTRQIFSGAYARRGAAYGPAGSGGIYITNRDTGATSPFATIPAGGTPHPMDAATDDGGFVNTPGKESLGDLEISEDGSELYVVNFFDKNLYVFDATQTTANAPKARYAIPDPGCAGGVNNWRPMGLGVRDRVLYVGGVCSGESTKNIADVKAIVYAANPATGAFGSPIINKTLDFPRGYVWLSYSANTWNPWENWDAARWSRDPTGLSAAWPQPMLSDIAVDKDGSLLLGFRDRFGDQNGVDEPDPYTGNSNPLRSAATGGDLVKVCRDLNTGAYNWEGAGGCPNNNTGPAVSGQQAANVLEYFPGEFYKEPGTQNIVHQEVAQGAIAFPLQQQRMAVTSLDPARNIFVAGVGWYDRTDGNMAIAADQGRNNAYEITHAAPKWDTVAQTPNTDESYDGYGKSGGLGDLEVLCDFAPVQIGSRVFYDANRDGVQNPDEQIPVAGVKVQLLDSAGNVVATKTTDANGRYFFDAADGVKPNTDYKIKYDYTGADTSKIPGAPAPSDLGWTTPNVGSNQQINSKPDPAPGANQGITPVFNSGDPGKVTDTQNAGLIIPPGKVGDFVWDDKNNNGIHDPGEPGIANVTVILKDANGNPVANKPAVKTDANGNYTFDKLPLGKYQVCFDRSTAAAPYNGTDYGFTQVNQGTDATKNSKADTNTGCGPVIELTQAAPVNNDQDAGLTPPPGKVGDFVWDDKNNNGIHDPGEPGIANVTVILKDANGNPVANKPAVKTDANGNYTFDKLPLGKYQVCFDQSTAAAPYNAAPYAFTQANQGTDVTKNSKVDPVTRCAPVVELTRAAPVNNDQDAGLAKPPGQLGDFVWSDLSRNGTQDLGEPPIQGVKVTLKDANGNPVNDPSGQPRTATTDANGKYSFTDLPLGKYQVCFDKASLPQPQYAGFTFTQANQGTDATKNSKADPGTGCTPVVELTQAAPVNNDQDAGFISPVNRLGDFMWIDTNKNGIQDAGEPAVAGVRVTLKDANGNAVPGVNPATTDANGKYLFDNLLDGTYQVCFDKSSFPTQYKDYLFTQANQGTDATKNSKADPATGCAAPVTLGLNGRENLNVDAGIIAPPNKLGDFVWIDTNFNGAQDASEPPVQGVTVTLKDDKGQSVAGVNPQTTDANGKYLFDNLPDGKYQVCFDKATLPAQYKGYQFTMANAPGDVTKNSKADPATGCAALVTLDVNKRTDLDQDAGFMPPKGKIGDFVWIDANKDGRQDAGESPIQGMKVTLKDGNGQPVAGVNPATADATGKYLFDKLPVGKYQVCFDKATLPAQYSDYQFTKVNVPGDVTKNSKADPGTGCGPVVELTDAAPENLDQDAGFSPPVNRLGDFVWIDANKDGRQDPGEPPVQGVTMIAKDSAGKEVGRATTDATGKYLVENVPDGSYQVCVDKASLPVQYKDYTFTKKRAGANGNDSAVDSASGCSDNVTLGTGSRENLTLDAGLVVPPNMLGDFVWVDANRNGVQDVGESVVAGVSVMLKDGNGNPVVGVNPVITDARGMYSFASLPDGVYRVCFDGKNLPDLYKGYLPTKLRVGELGKNSAVDPATWCTQPVRLGVGMRQDLTLDLGLRPPNQVGELVWVDINGNGIQDVDELGVPDVTAILKDANGGPVANVAPVKTDASGKYLFPNLADGIYQVCFDLSSADPKYREYQFTMMSVSRAVGQGSRVDPATGCTPPSTLGVDNPVDLTLNGGIKPPTNRVGYVVWVDHNRNGVFDSGEPTIAGVRVLLNKDGKQLGDSQLTGESGTYMFSNLVDGTYNVCFDLKNLPEKYAGYVPTGLRVGGDGTKNSAVKADTGCTDPVTLGPGNRQNLTLNLGVVKPVTGKPPLAKTGVEVAGLIGLAALLLAGGVAIMITTQRRRRRNTE